MLITNYIINNPNVLKFNILFLAKDPWILNGMYDYYMATNSTRALDVLVTVREPHDKFLFDRYDYFIYFVGLV